LFQSRECGVQALPIDRREGTHDARHLEAPRLVLAVERLLLVLVALEGGDVELLLGEHSRDATEDARGVRACRIQAAGKGDALLAVRRVVVCKPRLCILYRHAHRAHALEG
jgi:hypothetical protein